MTLGVTDYIAADQKISRASTLRTLFACLILACFWPAGAIAQISDVVIAPHHAEYAVELGGKIAGEKVVARGQATLRIQRDCRQWTKILTLRISIPSGKRPRILQASITAIEALDKRAFEYRGGGTVDGQTREIMRAVGRVGPDGRVLAVVTEEGKRTKVELPRGILFPISFEHAVLRVAVAGKGKHRALVFDGTVNGFVVDAETDIRPIRVPIGIAVPKALQGRGVYLLRTKNRPKRAAAGAGESTDQIIALDNGVILTMRAGFSGLAVSLRLNRAVPLPKPTCPRG